MDDLSGVIIQRDGRQNLFVGVGETKDGITVQRKVDGLFAVFDGDRTIRGLGVLDPNRATLARVKKIYRASDE